MKNASKILVSPKHTAQCLKCIFCEISKVLYKIFGRGVPMNFDRLRKGRYISCKCLLITLSGDYGAAFLVYIIPDFKGF